MELNLYALKTFKEVVEQQSFSKAAQVLFLTQPAVSLQIQSLESYFQTPLLIRSHAGKIKPTQEGRTVYNYATKLEDLLHELLQSLNKSTQNSFCTLRLGICYIGGEYFFPELLKGMQLQHPDIRVSLSVLKCEKIFHGILSGIFDLGITDLLPHHKGLVNMELGKVPLLLFQEFTNQAPNQPISIKELLKHPLLLREEGSGIYKEFTEFLKSRQLGLKHFKNVYFSESNQAIKSMVKAGLAFSLLPNFMLQEELRAKEIAPIRLKEGGLQQRFYLIYRKQAELPRSMQLMLDFIQSSIQESWTMQGSTRDAADLP